MAHNILLVDDDVDYLTAMRLQLESAGYHVTAVESVAAAQEAIKEQVPDAAIVDLMIDEPDDGFSMCHFLKKNHPSMPVILVTAVTSETGLDFDASTKEERAWIKADVVLAKPVRFEQLERELSRLGVEA
ncbi:MAG: response regulator [Phycisphaerae bacterium]|nr:response regulator [Phycisphaerae bacterium]